MITVEMVDRAKEILIRRQDTHLDSLAERLRKPRVQQHGEPLLNSAAYHEIAPHLVLMAFLHRVVNGGGTLNREYAIGSDQMDLCLRYGSVTLGMELKVWRDKRPDPLDRGLQQLESYLARLGVTEGWLVISDRRSDAAEIAVGAASRDENRTQVGMAHGSAPYAITVIRA
jgi:hypothetical protein